MIMTCTKIKRNPIIVLILLASMWLNLVRTAQPELSGKLNVPGFSPAWTNTIALVNVLFKIKPIKCRSLQQSIFSPLLQWNKHRYFKKLISPSVKNILNNKNSSLRTGCCPCRLISIKDTTTLLSWSFLQGFKIILHDRYPHFD